MKSSRSITLNTSIPRQRHIQNHIYLLISWEYNPNWANHLKDVISILHYDFIDMGFINYFIMSHLTSKYNSTPTYTFKARNSSKIYHHSAITSSNKQ